MLDAVPIRTANDLIADDRDWHTGPVNRSECPSTLRAVLDIDVRVGNAILRQRLAQAHAVAAPRSRENDDAVRSVSPPRIMGERERALPEHCEAEQYREEQREQENELTFLLPPREQKRSWRDLRVS
jgi:hypothetical protein